MNEIQWRRTHFAIKKDGKYKHFPAQNYNTELNKSCLFLSEEAAYRNASIYDEVVQVELREIPKEEWAKWTK
ncbi:hypothetical protein [Candidatus Enterococcus clewellii]|uniref:Uncharacterized protein n=1 Tax=Candidatus Enterococcus clewellii TaxID=1834193 RepID=A0A242K8R8_9ENTE|nr:hypothetical protein [Enterococcus sp. 9E7_DIV0242]OTP17565.1 hypothetical protein A5888_001703 [Enterococcus sp. 9E7_DIV0242]